MSTESTQGRNLSKPIPERIREGREARGLTLEAFAEALDVSKQAVGQYESGQITPSGDVMGRIISITGQPPSFFVTPRTRSAIRPPFWRGLKRMELHHRKRIARRLEWANDVTDFISSYIDLPEVALPPIEFDPNSGSVHEIEAAADAIREYWNLGRGPIRELAPTMEMHGIVLIREKVGCDDMDAVSCWQNGRPFVLFSADVESGPRCTYNLAHELGHIVLHSTVEVSIDNLSRIEKQANRFASAFLLPQETFSREIFGTSIEHFLFLKERWGIAISAMAYRCKDLGIFSDNQFAYLMKQMNVMKIRMKEPLDEKFHVGTPCVLAESIKMIVENGVQTKAQIEEALCLNMADIESLCGLPQNFLDKKVVSFSPRKPLSN